MYRLGVGVDKNIDVALSYFQKALAETNKVFQVERRNAQRRACLARQKTLAGAVEMYNMENDDSLHELSESLLDPDGALVKGGFLPGNWAAGITSNCKYSSTGDLVEGGRIFCDQHRDAGL